MGFKSVGGQRRASQQRFSTASKYDVSALESSLYKRQDRKSVQAPQAKSLSKHLGRAATSVELSPADNSQYARSARDSVRSPTTRQSTMQQQMVLSPPESPRSASPQRTLARSGTVPATNFAASQVPFSPDSTRSASPSLRRARTVGDAGDEKQRPATARDMQRTFAGNRLAPGEDPRGSGEHVAQKAGHFALRKDYGGKHSGAFPMPTHSDAHAQGKWVRHDKESDSRGGTSMMASVIVKEQEEGPDHVGHGTGGLDQGVAFNGFTDRYIRVQDGKAMKVLLAGHPGADHNSARHPPNCKCPMCKPLQSSLLPPAGQVCQVDVGNRGTPPYILQVESDGVMPMHDRPYGRLEFKKRPGCPPPVHPPTDEEQALVARGCRKVEKQDAEHQSKGIMAAMGAHHVPQDETEKMMRKRLGHKRVPPNLIHDRTTSLVHDDESPPVERKGRCYATRIFATHHFSPTGAPEKNLIMPKSIASPREDSPGGSPSKFAGLSAFQRTHRIRLKSPGEFQNTFSDITIKQCITGKDHLRYEDPEHPRGKDFSSTMMSTHHWSDTGSPEKVERCSPRPSVAPELARSKSAPPAKDVRAGVSSAVGNPKSDVRRGLRILDRPENHSKTSRVLDHVGPELTSFVHDMRIKHEDAYIEKCAHTQTISRSVKNMSDDIKQRMSHHGSSGVANSLCWAG